MYQPIRGQNGHLLLTARPEKHKPSRGRFDLLPVV